MNIVGHRKIFYVLSGALMLGAALSIIVFGLHLGIDFTGGSLVEVEFTGPRPSADDLVLRLMSVFGSAESGIRLQPSGERGLIIRLRHISEAEHRSLLGTLGGGVVEKNFDTIGPAIGAELERDSLVAIVLVIVLIVSYVAFAFRKVSAPVASWKYGVATVAALAHDVLIPTGLFALGGRLYGVEADALFVTAILTILGFSVHDTIVVFDRIRENLKKSNSRADFGAIVNQSVNETFTRSINTSLTVALAMIAVYLFGGVTTRVFSLTLVVGVIVGTYSSIFIASPLLVTWYERRSGR